MQLKCKNRCFDSLFDEFHCRLYQNLHDREGKKGLAYSACGPYRDNCTGLEFRLSSHPRLSDVTIVNNWKIEIDHIEIFCSTHIYASYRNNGL